MPEEKPSDRAVRMVDFSNKEAGITFNFGKPVTDEQIEETMQMLEELEETPE